MATIIIGVEIVAAAWCGVWWRSRGGVVMTMVEVAVMMKVVSMVVMVVVTTTLKGGRRLWYDGDDRDKMVEMEPWWHSS